jgi:hypothetical protein
MSPDNRSNDSNVLGNGMHTFVGADICAFFPVRPRLPASPKTAATQSPQWPTPRNYELFRSKLVYTTGSEKAWRTWIQGRDAQSFNFGLSFVQSQQGSGA